MTLRVACPSVVTLAVALVLAIPASAQKPDPALEKLRTDYEQAWKRGDVKALTALYTEDALGVGAQGTVTRGRANLEKQFSQDFAGPWKGTTISITLGTTQPLSPEISVNEGTFAVAGAAPMTGHYVNTVVKKDNAWLIAGSAAFVPQPSGAQQKTN
jgi:uncharacterized protein (TIGR02246 family)